MSYQNFAGYDGDLLATDAYALLAGDASSVLIDVRTKAEWAYVGAPDIRTLGKTPFFLEWQTYPSMEVDTNFAARLEALLKSAGVERGASLVFLCRSGARSRHAAVAMTCAGGRPVSMSRMGSKVRWMDCAEEAASAGGRQVVCPGRRRKGSGASS